MAVLDQLVLRKEWMKLDPVFEATKVSGSASLFCIRSVDYL